MGCAPSTEAATGVKYTPPSVDCCDSSAFLLDVRPPEERVLSRGYIASSHEVNIAAIKIADFSSLPSDLKKDSRVIMVCSVGRRAAQAARILTRNGYTDVTVLTGGIRAWKAADLPLVTKSRKSLSDFSLLQFRDLLSHCFLDAVTPEIKPDVAAERFRQTMAECGDFDNPTTDCITKTMIALVRWAQTEEKRRLDEIVANSADFDAVLSALYARQEAIEAKGLGEVEDVYGSGSGLFIDARSHLEYQTSHLAKAINIPWESFADGAVAEQAKKLPGDKDATLVVCCSSGTRAGFLKCLLTQNGYKDVRNAADWSALSHLDK
eukprot:TRINITY_DN67570_c3_g1_i1.p1 TRINITY_DN67570_c3_g1~~TRINITY_DN67570_c3_g1_i1.p1  ORF type:complete len:322 (-),score=26.68 TRINITY_DN67570_c3_g1_i1:399-1364(-)